MTNQNRINCKVGVYQIVSATTSSVVTCSTALPFDNSIPQQGTEGTEVITLAITPKSATSTLEIRFAGMSTKDATGGTTNVALFQDSTANALSAIGFNVGGSGGGFIFLRHFMTSGTTSSTTFKIKVGPAANTVYVNGTAAGGALFNGTATSRLTIIEYI